MSLPLLHAGRTNPGLSAALDLRFALDKSLTAYRGPTPSFSRASTGSYFDGSGVLRYANVNLLLQSEAFSTSPWSNLGLPTITTNTDIAPDGKQTADTINDSSTGSFWGVNQTISVTSGATYTFSIYIKKTFVSPTSYPLIQIQVGASNYSALIFNTFNGSISVATGGSYVAPSSYQSVEISGYWRVSITAVINTSSPQMQFYPAGSSDGSTISAAATGSAVVWGAQLEASSTVGTYVSTTNAANSAPRFDHTFNGTSWVSRGLLVEEQRTNVVLNSANFTSGWTTANVAMATSSGTSPDGTNTAVKLYPTASTTQTRIYRSSTQSCISVFAKAAEKGFVYFYDLTGVGVCWFNLSTGAIGTNGTSLSASIVNCGNGWFRCSLATSSGTFSFFQIGVSDANGSTSSTASGTNGVLIWGAQEEAGSFATSYIPTTSASATRSADVCQITGGDFSGFWNGTEGTLACEFDRLSSVTSSFSSGFPHAVSLVDSGNLVRQGFYGGHSGASPTGEIFLYNGSGRITAGALVSGTSPIKISGAYKASDFAGSLNGATAVTSSSGSIDPVVQMNIGAWASSQYMLNGHIARLRYYRKRLPNATLQQLSEPDPTLNLQFALNKSLTPVAGPAPSFSRASAGTYFNSSGVLTSASINTPRFDHTYDGTSWISKGLLIEEQRTNLLTYSEQMNSGWTNNNINISANSVTAPDGNLTADNLIPNTVNTNHRIYQGPAGSGSAVFSCFAKSTGYGWLQVRVGAGGGTVVFVNFDVINGTVGNVFASVGASSPAQSIIPVGNGWFRCVFSMTGLPLFSTVIMPRNSNATTEGEAFSGNGTDGIAVWGTQLESGVSFPTSYIPTTTTSVTRSADVCQITGTSFNWMWNQGEGSVVAEYDRLANNSSGLSGGYPTTFSASSSNSLWMVLAGSIAPSPVGEVLAVYDTTSQAYFAAGSSPLAGIVAKMSACYKANDFAASLNGSAVSTDTSGTVPVCNQIGIGYWPYGNAPVNGHIAKLIYYPARLTNTKLQQLST